ncbi:hypothetical protein G6011_07951 [Alternaria panax]|uniref:Uncharacterized protein n=1 Tax=Alternaria panax TaxID=48097 RepID=A0AAD4F8E6_9PLEO|nr:hypothetical protein G6011_07951 [Alternaria panax]
MADMSIITVRNRIYEAIIADEEPKIFCPRCSRYELPLDSEGSLKDRHPSRQYLGLTQANHMLRSESMPPYMAARRPAIDLNFLPKYLEVLPLTDSALSASITTISRELRIGRNTEAPGIDLLPLLRADRNMLPFCTICHLGQLSSAATCDFSSYASEDVV